MRTIATEAEVLRAVLDLLAYESVWAMRINTAAQILTDNKGNRRFLQSHSAGRGVADILALVEAADCDECGGGGFTVLWIETKSAIGRQSPEQRTFQEDVERRGHRYVIARSIDDVIRTLKEIRG